MPAGDGSSIARGGVRATDRGDSDGDDGGRSAARRASAAGDAGTGRACDLRAGDKTRAGSTDFRADLRGDTYRVLRES